MNRLLHIRTQVFGLPQAGMAEIAKVSQGTVSKWETDQLQPDRREMDRIRREAHKRGLDWDDRWFFEAAE